MAQESLVITIRADGVRRVKRDLNDIGLAGTKAQASTRGLLA